MQDSHKKNGAEQNTGFFTKKEKAAAILIAALGGVALNEKCNTNSSSTTQQNSEVIGTEDQQPQPPPFKITLDYPATPKATSDKNLDSTDGVVGSRADDTADLSTEDAYDAWYGLEYDAREKMEDAYRLAKTRMAGQFEVQTWKYRPSKKSLATGEQIRSASFTMTFYRDDEPQIGIKYDIESNTFVLGGYLATSDDCDDLIKIAEKKFDSVGSAIRAEEEQWRSKFQKALADSAAAEDGTAENKAAVEAMDFANEKMRDCQNRLRAYMGLPPAYEEIISEP